MLSSPLRRVLALLGVLGVIVAMWLVVQFFPPGGSGKLVMIHVHQGDTMAVIAADLHQAGVLASPLAFRIDSFVEGAPLVVPGVYEFAQGADFFTIRSILGGGPNVPQVNVTPGLTIKEVALDLAHQVGNNFASTFLNESLSAARTSPYHPNGSLDGLIGPGLYLINPGESPAQLLTAMQTTFTREANAAGLSATTSVQGLNAYQVVTVASIVEKEGYFTFNMPKTARVIYNRLARTMPLQMDSTVLYALGRDGGKVTPEMLQTATPYNTYRHLGLTPTPICVVSPAALAASLNPPPGPWLYFVLVNKDGHMAFATTFREQLRNEALAAKAGL